jgi:CheY-like chemotaxis protein
VVDDNQDAADSLSALLQLMGHEVRTAYDGLEAVAAAGSFAPDLVLLDIGLPKMNGYEAARRIREQPGGRDLHITKPLDPAILRTLLLQSSPERLAR